MPFYYLYIYLIIAAFAVFEAVRIERSVHRVSLLIIVVLFVVTAGLKFETGVDWYIYTHIMFKKVPPIDKIFTDQGKQEIFDTLDVGFNILISIVKYLGGNIQTIFFLFSLTSALFLYTGLRRYTSYPVSGLLLYYCILFFMLDMSGIRQGLALTIFFYALKFVHRREFGKYFLYLIFATLFHWSACILIPVFFLLNRNLSNKILVILLPVALCIFFLNIKWLEFFIINVIPNINNEILITKAFIYTTSSTFATSWKLHLTTIINVGSNLFFFFLLLVHRERLKEKYEYFYIFFNLFLIQMFIYFCFSELIEIAERLKLFFLVSYIVLLPYFIGLYRKRAEKVLVSGLIALYAFSVSRAYILERSATIAYHPYQNYLIHRIFDLESTGDARLTEHIKIHEQ